MQRWLLVTFGVLSAACGGGTVASSPSDAGIDTHVAQEASSGDSAAPPPDAAGPTIEFGGTIVASGAAQPLPGATVCVAETPTCAMTDSTGAFSLQVPANANVPVTVERTGFTSILVALATSTENQTSWEIGTLAADTTTSNYAAAGIPYPSASVSFLNVIASPAGGGELGESGVAFTMSPSAAIGPVYFNGSGEPTPSLTSTSSYSVAIASFATSMADVTVTFGPSTLTCVPSFGGWTVAAPNAVKVPLLAGFETHVASSCQ